MFEDEHLPVYEPHPMEEPTNDIGIQEGAGHMYRLSQQEGEKELHLLAQKSLIEDSWLYISGYWIDIGYDEQQGNVFCTLNETLEAIIEKAGYASVSPAENTGLIWYHIHPKARHRADVFPPGIEDILALIRKDLQARNLKRDEKIILYLSSAADLGIMLTYTNLE